MVAVPSRSTRKRNQSSRGPSPGSAPSRQIKSPRTVEAQKLTDYLMAKHRIHVRPRFVPGEWEGVRVTPNVYTTLNELDTFARAIREVAGRT